MLAKINDTEWKIPSRGPLFTPSISVKANISGLNIQDHIISWEDILFAFSATIGMHDHLSETDNDLDEYEPDTDEFDFQEA